MELITNKLNSSSKTPIIYTSFHPSLPPPNSTFLHTVQQYILATSNFIQNKPQYQNRYHGLLCIGSVNGKVGIISPQFQLLGYLCTAIINSSINSLVYMKEQHLLATGSHSYINLWNMWTRTHVGSLQTPGEVTALAIAGKMLISSNAQGTINIFNLHPIKCINRNFDVGHEINHINIIRHMLNPHELVCANIWGEFTKFTISPLTCTLKPLYDKPQLLNLSPVRIIQGLTPAQILILNKNKLSLFKGEENNYLNGIDIKINLAEYAHLGGYSCIALGDSQGHFVIGTDIGYLIIVVDTYSISIRVDYGRLMDIVKIVDWVIVVTTTAGFAKLIDLRKLPLCRQVIFVHTDWCSSMIHLS